MIWTVLKNQLSRLHVYSDEAYVKALMNKGGYIRMDYTIEADNYRDATLKLLGLYQEPSSGDSGYSSNTDNGSDTIVDPVGD